MSLLGRNISAMSPFNVSMRETTIAPVSLSEVFDMFVGRSAEQVPDWDSYEKWVWHILTRPQQYKTPFGRGAIDMVRK